MSTESNERRRGDNLEQAIFQNTLKVLNTEGYSAISFARIARESNTSRSVLYHHWDSPFDLTLAAVHNQNQQPAASQTMVYYDTGQLRSDLLFIGQHFILELNKIPENFRGALLVEMSQSPRQVQKILTEADALTTKVLHQALQQAITRQELVDLPNQTSQNALLKLIRYSFIIENHPVTQSELEDMIDAVVLPAITH